MNEIALNDYNTYIKLDKVINNYYPTVKKIAYHISSKFPNNIEIDDLIQAGMIGLLEAAKLYDASKGASFATYAGILQSTAYQDLIYLSPSHSMVFLLSVPLIIESIIGIIFIIYLYASLSVIFLKHCYVFDKF